MIGFVTVQYVRHDIDRVFRAGVGMSKRDILCLLSETIILKDSPQKLKVSLAWVLL